MKKVIETEENEGFESLLGDRILVMCANYFYSGMLVGVNDDFILLKDPSIVYETGKWSESGYSNAEKLHVDFWRVRIEFIESYGLSK